MQLLEGLAAENALLSYRVYRLTGENDKLQCSLIMAESMVEEANKCWFEAKRLREEVCRTIEAEVEKQRVLEEQLKR